MLFYWVFQSTLPRRERRENQVCGLVFAVNDFNPRSREGSDDFILHSFTAVCYFNPRSREGSDTAPPVKAIHNTPFQSTLPRRERRSHQSTKDTSPKISIHAPAKGATSCSINMQDGCSISIHAPAKGATLDVNAAYAGSCISIHAPAKGATAKITKTIPNDLRKINNYNNSFTQICAKHNCKFDIR